MREFSHKLFHEIELSCSKLLMAPFWEGLAEVRRTVGSLSAKIGTTHIKRVGKYGKSK
jgi:hypothetical protein